MREMIDPATAIGAVHLTIADLPRSRQFYENVIGLHPLRIDDQEALLGVGERPLLYLRALPGARSYRRYTGLYHFALRVPTRAGLAHTLRHLASAQAPFVGFADHHVSEAIYLTDPDGHGIEIYRDRPRSDWADAQGRFFMTTERLDIDDLLSERWQGAWQGLPDGTDMGHIHLQVADVAEAQSFYTGGLGFGTMIDLSGASFLSAGGYHHHIGLNAWNSSGAPAPPADAARLLAYEVLLPDATALAAVVAAATAAGTPLVEDSAWGGYRVVDPSGNGIVLRAT